MNEQGAFDWRWAEQKDERDIRNLIGSVAMPGAVSMRFAREPDYFLGATIMGDPCEVLIARHGADASLAAMGCRAERLAFLNGREAMLGYIGQIRVAGAFRGTWLVQRGAQAFRERGRPDMVYFGVIASDNPRARQLLAGGRLPGNVHVRRMCGMTTHAIVLRPQRIPQVQGIEINSCSTADLRGVVEFLRSNGPSRQFFPAYRLDDFTEGKRMRGLAPEDIMVARRRGTVVGVMAAWDQAHYKQDIVEAYGPRLRQLRPFYDFVARLIGIAPLTSPGLAIPLAFAACVSVAEDNLDVMRVLLAACGQSARMRGKAFLMLGLADNDPLLAAAQRPLHVTYHSDLYAASWTADVLCGLDMRAPYIEIATL